MLKLDLFWSGMERNQFSFHCRHMVVHELYGSNLQYCRLCLLNTGKYRSLPMLHLLFRTHFEQNCNPQNLKKCQYEAIIPQQVHWYCNSPTHIAENQFSFLPSIRLGKYFSSRRNDG